MTRGEGTQNKVHYRGETQDFLVFVENAEMLDEWRHDPAAVPLTNVLNGWKVFTTHRQGNKNNLISAVKGQLESEFGTHDLTVVIDTILTKGQFIRNVVRPLACTLFLGPE